MFGLRREGVRRSAISPRAGTPEDQAAVVALLAADESRYVNGQVIDDDEGAGFMAGPSELPE